MELSKIKGIGPKTIEYLNKINIYDCDSLLRYYPYRYNVLTPTLLDDNTSDETIIIPGTITSLPKVSYIKRNFNRLSFTFETNKIPINVVIFNRAFLARNLTIGKKVTLVGKYNRLNNQFVAADILLYELKSTKVEPVYHTINGLKMSTITKSINNCLLSNIEIKEIIPEYITSKYDFIDTKAAIKEIHNPSNTNLLKSARLKLIYEELFEFMFKINIMKYKNQIYDDFSIKLVEDNALENILSSIPFSLTNDQLSAINEIISDFKGFKRMNRLILGDVGSGKTIVAFIAIILNKLSGFQSALLAPTEVLAHQHYENFISLFKDIKVGLLVGSLTKKEKNEIIEKLKNNEIDLLIGTHAMLEENVEFANIGLVITDEQHRFGVNQRKSLQNKGKYVDVLYMSATPIPRTYALTIYGDMDISYIKEKPAGRKDIITKQYKFKDMKKIVSTIEEELENGHQAYVIAPLIEDENNTELNDLKQIEDILKENLKKNYNVGILHGKMKQVEKDKVMNNFKEGNLDILISTTVIEVGVDVKNATIITIFNAERFGLATLHQLRGRVGRNSLQSKCLLISDKDTERLSVMEESNDGFYISEKDFEIRGSGDLFGIRQSGDMTFKIADIRRDFKILLQCKKDAEDFVLNNIETDFRDYSYYKDILEHLINNN
ncbi:MAG: ATP-dependent DNA helicase RecG [Erysipelotrichales bacterium]|nr:ATP-dependent DNA helicase RecG [Erysipelotrichales bacterium]